MVDVVDYRPAASRVCIHWAGDHCGVGSNYPVAEVTCYNEGNCNGFGTCRGCNRYDSGGLKVDQVDADSGTTQTPMNLRMYNIRARIKPCCLWDGAPVDFEKDSHGQPNVFSSPFSVVQNVPPDFYDPEAEQDLVDDAEQGDTVTLYELTSTETKCSLEAAAPWQVNFTEENPTAYGCNGAKAECPYYTGPRFTENVDEKLEYGDRVTAKQVLELRYHSADWASMESPREEWEKRFENPDIWAWARDETLTYSDVAGNILEQLGRLDEQGNPLLVKVSIEDFSNTTPVFIVDPPRAVSTGTPTIGAPPKYPDLVKELFSLTAGMEVVWPTNTSVEEPFLRETFTAGERQMMVAVQVSSDREIYAVNTTKHPQEAATDVAFITRLQAEYPEDVVLSTGGGEFASRLFFIPLVFLNDGEKLNRIKIYLDTGAEDGSMLTAEVFVRHIFYHAEVAQTSFVDFYGHNQVDPWVDHFTKLSASANFLHLTNNTKVHDVFLNTVTGAGKKTMYAIEGVELLEGVGESNDLVSWEPIGCNMLVVTFKDPRVNRVLPWSVTGNADNAPLFALIDRSGNGSLSSAEQVSIDLELILSSPQGVYFPANVAFFRTAGGEAVSPFDVDKDALSIRYAYTEYKQGPIATEDLTKLKFREDLVAVTEQLPYAIDFSDTTMTVEGVFVKLDNGLRISSCEEVLGDCFSDKSLKNEAKSVSSFASGGVRDDDVQSAGDIITECAALFDARVAGAKLLSNGQAATTGTVADALTDLRLAESSLHFSVIFSNSEGRPVGVKKVAFITQSAMAQCRDVEIRYKWTGHLRHYRNNNGMILVAGLHTPMDVTNNRLLRVVQEYDPACGDHKENTIGDYEYGAFDLAIDKHGPLWYPYTRCERPTYHADSETYTNVIEYEHDVEGFGGGKRQYYWERMRFWDQWMPIILGFIPQIGCFWSERTTTLNVYSLAQFTGYTRIRSSNPFGDFSTDREALRVSRHWEKRNLALTSEIISQEEGGLSVKLAPEAYAAMYDPETQELKSGSEAQTFKWVHINDGLAVVDPASESMSHPFGRYLLANTGSHTFGESFSDDRLGVNEVFSERDYTSTLDRSEDGTKIFLPNGTTLSTPQGVVEESQGRDIRWVFTDQDTGWAWFPPPAKPERGSPLVTGLFLNNPKNIIYKENRTPATYTTEGNHLLTYTPHQFTEDGDIEQAASVKLDSGPELFISQTTGNLFILEGSSSPYDETLHEGEDYQFGFDTYPGRFVLADGRGLQRFTQGEEKFSTLAGIEINTTINVDNLPFQVVDIRSIEHLSTTGDTETDIVGQLDEAAREYLGSERTPLSFVLDFSGHYYVEKVIIDFAFGGEYDIPVLSVSGNPKAVGQATIFGSETVPASVEQQLLPLTSYLKGSSREEQASRRELFSVNQRLFRLKLDIGARTPDRKMIIEGIRVEMRENEARTETVFTYAPKINRSQALTGTHKPSDLEFYFQRSFPDFAKDYLMGTLSIADLGGGNVHTTKLPGTSLKWQGQRIKDIIPIYDFTDPINNRFPFNNIDMAAIPGYTVETIGPNTSKFIGQAIQTSSKGWTLHTSRHYTDTAGKDSPTDTGPLGQPNVIRGGQPNEDLQEALYQVATEGLGDRVSLFSSFWHPAEVEFFAEAGVELEQYNWELSLRSEPAPLRHVFQHDSYGCLPGATFETHDGRVHKVVNWQAKGIFHYQCDARFSWACFTTVMNKCNAHLYQDFGTSEYHSNDIIQKFTYVFRFPPREYGSWRAAGLINQNEVGGIIGGTGPFSAAFATATPNHNQLAQQYNSNLPMKGPGPYA